MLSTLKPGVVTVYKDGGSPTRDGGAAERIFVKGGMVEVNPQGLTLLAEVAIPMAELSAEALAKQIKDAEQTSPTPSRARPPARPTRTSTS